MIITITAVAVSSDGRTIVAGEDPGRLWISHDAGENWAPQQDSTSSDNSNLLSSATYTAIALSSDGKKVHACTYGGGNIYSTKNAGKQWKGQKSAAPAGDLWQVRNC